MDQAMIIGALVLAGGSIVAVIRFWMDLGATLARAKEAEEAASEAKATASASAAKAEFVHTQLLEYKAEAKAEFASLKALAAAENRFANAVDGMRGDFNRMTERLNKLIDSQVMRS